MRLIFSKPDWVISDPKLREKLDNKWTWIINNIQEYYIYY